MLTLPEKEQQKKMKMKRKEKTFRANILFIYIVEEKGDNEKKENDTKMIQDFIASLQIDETIIIENVFNPVIMGVPHMRHLKN